MALEGAGIPTVAVHTHVFARLAKSVATVNGMPTTRQAFVPQPVVGQSPEALRAYIEGTDPVNGRPFMQEIIEGLTKPLEATDEQGTSIDRSTPRFLDPDTEENLQALFVENRWTDFLPVVLPTEERVEAMLKATSRKPDEVVGKLRPTAYREFWQFDVEKVAVNAVMAGAKPEYLPVILAMASTGVSARSSSTTSFAAVSLVNGPIRNEIGMNSGTGSMGPYSQANSTIGRAYALLSQNLQGGSVPGETYMGSQGNFTNYNGTFAENEEASPWEPFHVQHGYKPEESVVSCFMGGWYTIFGGGPRETWEELFQRSLRACDPFTPPIVCLDPLVAKGLVDRGYDTKAKLQEKLAELGTLPAREYWDNQWIQTLFHPLAVSGVEPYATRLKAAPDEHVQMFRAEDVHVVVVGGQTGAMWKMIGGMLRDGQASVDAWR